ncbi:MAG: PKD domain-containing protein, partial [Thermoplasmata archaeon]
KCALWALNFSISEIEVDCIAFVVEDSKNLTEDEKAITTYLNTHEIEYNIIDASCFGAVEYSPSQRFIVCSQGLIGNMPIDRRDAGYLLLGDALYDISTALGFHAFNINSTWNINESLEAYQLIDYPSLNSLNLPKPFILFTNLTNVSSIRNAMEDLDQNFLNIICPYDKEPLYEKSILAMYELQEGMQLCAYSFKPSYENDFDSLSWKIFNRMIWSIVESNTHPGIENINITRCGNSINFSALVYERCGIVETVKLHWAWSNSLSAWNTVSMTYIGNDIYFYLFTDMNSSIHYYLEAFGMDGKVEKTEIFEVNPNYVGNIPPVPVINYTFMSYFKDYRVDFNCSASYDPDGNITAYYINFGDGYSTGWQESYKSTHSYVKSGYYVVTLSVRDNVGAISEIRITIFVGSGDGNTRPNAYFTYYPSQPREYEEITFDASASYDADGDIIYYFWDFDDGITGDGVIERHTFTKAGFYHVSLMVSDGKSSSSWYVNLHIYSRGEDELPDTSIYQAIGVLLLIIVIVFAVIFVVYMLSKKKKIYPSFVSSYAPIRQCPKCMQTLYYSLSLGVYYCYYCRKHYHEKQLISINESNPQTTQTQPKIEEEQKTKHVETSNMKEVQKVAKQVQKETRDDTYDTKISISTSAKCPKCKTIIKIESNERPIALQCPNCGTKGTLK